MADGETERITILLQAQAAEFDRTMKRTQREFARAMRSLDKDSSVATRKLEANLKSAGASALTFGANFAKGLAISGITALLAGFTASIRSTIISLADLKDEADRLGLSTDTFQELQYGMKLAGVEANEFNNAMARFTDNVGDAVRGSGALKDIFAANGIALYDLRGNVRPTTELLGEFADLIQRIPDEATRMSLITEAFGKGGKAMTLALAGGSAGLVQMGVDAQAAGAIIDESVIAQAAALDDEFDELTAGIRTFFMESAMGWAAMGRDAWSAGEAIKEAFENAFDEGNSSDLVQAAGDLQRALEKAIFGTLNDPSLASAGVLLSDLSAKLNDIAGAFQTGAMTEKEFAQALTDLELETVQFLGALEEVNGVDFSAIIAEINGLMGVVDQLRVKTAAAAAGMANLAGRAGSTGGAGATAAGTGTIRIGGTGTGGGGGGARGGGGGGQNDQMREAQRLYEATRTDAEKYAAELIEINDLLADGYITQDTYNRALDAAKEKYAETTDAANFFQDVNTDLKNAFLDMAVDGVDSFDAIARAIKRAALEAALFGSGPMGGMLGGGLFGKVVGLFGKRANGGAVAAGQGYLVGENGPEHFYPGRSGAIVPHAKSGGGAVQVQVAGGDLVLTDSGQIAARIKVTAQQAAGAAVHTVKQNLPGWQRQYQTDGVIA